MSAPRVPVLVALAGHVGSGKSTLARALARELGALHVEGDLLRDELLASGRVSTGEPEPGVHWERAFGALFEGEAYAELLRRADAALASGRSVVLDACFPRNARRLDARARARRIGAPFLLVECRSGGETIRGRLAARDAAFGASGWQTLHDDLAATFEPVAELAPDEHLRVAGDRPVAESVAAIMAVPCLRRSPPCPPPPDAVTFDCWNTLLCEEDWGRAHAIRVEELRTAAREAGRDVSYEEADVAFTSSWELHMRLWHEGVASGAREVALSSLAALGLREPHPALEHLIDMFQQASHTSRVLALEGAPRLLEALAGAGIPCALVCDTGLTPGHVVRRHLERCGLLKGLAVQVFSDEVGVPKPDPRTFRAALDSLGVAPERAWHVGDLLRTDVAGARAVGMTSVRLSSPHDDASGLPEADHVVASHADLARLLGFDA